VDSASAAQVFGAGFASRSLAAHIAEAAQHFSVSAAWMGADGVERRIKGGGAGGEQGSTIIDGEIKAARRSSSKPLAGLVFLRAGRSGRVPLAGRTSMFSTLFPALGGHDESRI
jgi:hypothetical protein